MGKKTNPSNIGTVISVRGSVVDVRFEKHLPPIYTVLNSGVDGEIIIEVLSQLDEFRVRGIALTPTQGLARGMTVEDTGGQLKAPVGKGVLSRMLDVFGNTIDNGGALSDVQWRSVHQPPPSLSRRSTQTEILCVFAIIKFGIGSPVQSPQSKFALRTPTRGTTREMMICKYMIESLHLTG